ncbi:hypothetical protein KY358_03095 [Candidatus Woesearchaeota archaeon]|nr:hypothetical protein [Candidatus Woesearchaeota archaeon]
MMRKLVVFGLILIFLLSGCKEIKELYGIEAPGSEEYVPIEAIKVKESEGITEQPASKEEDIPEIEEIVEEIIEEIDKEEAKEKAAEVAEEEKAEETKEEEVKKAEEEAPEKPAGLKGKEAKVLIIKETETVSLKPKATDPDGDTLTFAYTKPIDDNGKWETTYGSAGEYTVTITASDGELSSTKDVLIIVNKKEEVPVIDVFSPEKDSLEANENSKIEFSIKASDLNGDPLTYLWKLDGADVSKTEAYTYDISYDDAGQHTVKALVSDGVKETSRIWSLKVENVNRKPILEKITDIRIKETEKFILEPKASDPDSDALEFSLDSDKFKKEGGRFEWETGYDDSGEYSVTVTASDGTDKAIQTVKLTVDNVNRAPEILDITLG